MGNYKHNRVRFAMHQGKRVLNVNWPDYSRSRIRVSDERKEAELRLRIELAILEGSWQLLRQELLIKRSRELPNSTLATVADEYLEKWVKTHNRDIRNKQRFLEDFKSRWGSLPIRAFSMSHADDYVRSRSREVKNASINRGLACLHHMLAWATRRRYLRENPLIGYEKLKEEPYVRRQVTPEVIKAIFARLHPLFVAVFTLIWQTAARRGEILHLKHEQVDRDKRQITLTKTKSGKNRIVPISDLAMEALDSVPPLPGCPYVFYNPETQTRWSDCRKPWESARKAAGYPWVTVKHLRPAMATEWSNGGLRTQFVSELLGHSGEGVTEKFYIKRKQEEACQQALRIMGNAS